MSTEKSSFMPVAPLSIVRMLWKSKLIILGCWLAISLAAYVVIRRLPAIYKAEALILVDSQKIPEKYVSSTVNTDVQDRITSISQQILSSNQLMKIIDDFGLYRKQRQTHYPEEILDMMRRDISIGYERIWTGGRPGAFRIGYQGPDQMVVAQVANRIANLYIEENQKTREVQAEGTSEFIESQLRAAKKKLDELEAALSAFKIQHNGELPQQEASLNGVLSRLQVQLEANRDAINRAQDSKLTLQNALNLTEDMLAEQQRALNTSAREATRSLPAPIVPVSPGTRTPTRLETLQSQLAALRMRYSDDHPDVKRLTAEIAQWRNLEEPQRPEPKPAAPSGSRAPARPPVTERASQSPEIRQAQERISSLRSQLALVEQELETRKTEQRRILNDIDTYQGRIGRLPIREQEMAQVTRDYEISKANYRSLLERKIAAQMATEMELRQKSERFTLADPARVPAKPIKPNRPMLAMMGSAMGLALGLVLGVGKELRQGVLLGEWELPPGVTVLGRLPHIRIPAEGWLEVKPVNKPRRRRRRLAVFSSALVSLLLILAAGFYFVSHRF